MGKALLEGCAAQRSSLLHFQAPTCNAAPFTSGNTHNSFCLLRTIEVEVFILMERPTFWGPKSNKQAVVHLGLCVPISTCAGPDTWHGIQVGGDMKIKPSSSQQPRKPTTGCVKQRKHTDIKKHQNGLEQSWCQPRKIFQISWLRRNLWWFAFVSEAAGSKRNVLVLSYFSHCFKLHRPGQKPTISLQLAEENAAKMQLKR